MITITLPRGTGLPKTFTRSRGRDTGKSIIIDAMALDIAITAALKWGHEEDVSKAVNMTDQSTGEQIIVSVPAGAISGLQIVDVFAPYIFVIVTPPNGTSAPVIDTESSTPASIAADIAATVNPGGSETDVTIELGTEEGIYSLPEVACVESPLAAGAVAVAVSASLGELTPATAYYWRVKAVNSIGISYGAEQTFVTAA